MGHPSLKITVPHIGDTGRLGGQQHAVTQTDILRAGDVGLEIGAHQGRERIELASGRTGCWVMALVKPSANAQEPSASTTVVCDERVLQNNAAAPAMAGERCSFHHYAMRQSHGNLKTPVLERLMMKASAAGERDVARRGDVRLTSPVIQL